jgi:hypothetical protein
MGLLILSKENGCTINKIMMKQSHSLDGSVGLQILKQLILYCFSRIRTMPSLPSMKVMFMIAPIYHLAGVLSLNELTIYAQSGDFISSRFGNQLHFKPTIHSDASIEKEERCQQDTVSKLFFLFIINHQHNGFITCQ